MNRRVVVTGMGVVAPNGTGLEAYDSALRAGKSGLSHNEEMAEAKVACTVADIFLRGLGQEGGG